MCACLAGVLYSVAQDRVALEDSVIVGGIPRSLVDMSLVDSEMTVDERLWAQWAYAELLKEVSREHLVIFSDQELRDLLAYFRTDAFRFLNSGTFLTVFIENVIKAMQSETGEGPAFSYTLNDKSYGAGLEPAFQEALGSVNHILDEMLGDDGTLISNAKRFGMPDSQIQLMKSAISKVMKNLFNIYRVSLVDYLSKDALKAVEDFVQSPLGNKYAIYSQKVRNIADMASDSFLAEFQSKLENNKFKTSQLKASLAEYVELSRSFQEYLPELWRPYAELTIGNGTYQGQTRDGKPHGKGKFVDKKGVVYEGDFKNGKRHGLLEVTKPGKPAETQYWIADRYRKEIPVCKSDNVILPTAFVEDGKRYGYGSVYDSEKRTRYQGVFTDGQLNGQGKVYEPNRSIEGEFVDGKLMDGVINWDQEGYLVMAFKGKMSENLGKGFREWVSQDGQTKEMHIGTFKDGLLEESGRRSFVKPNETSEYSGTFALGKMYGKGVHRRVFTNPESGIRETMVYNGGFYANHVHGEGKLKLSLRDIPGGIAWTFTRFGVVLPAYMGETLDIVMEGIFDDGIFKEGKVTFSDGTWLEGTFSEVGLDEGEMFIRYPDGSYYKGGCLGGKRHGYGELHTPSGNEYKGRFEYDDPVDVKIPDLPVKQEKYLVSYDDRTYEYKNIEGGFGKAVLIKPAGVKIMVRSSHSLLKVTCKGRFKGDSLIEGKVTMSDGNWLEGTFEDGVLIRGKGKIVDKYLVVYEGDIKNGYPHGEGKCTYTDKTWFKGKFANGNRMGGTHYDADGKVIKVYE